MGHVYFMLRQVFIIMIRYCIRLANSTVELESVWKSFADVLTKYYSISEDTLTWTAQICLGQRLNKFLLLILMTHMIWVISITQLLTHKSWVLDIDTSGGIFDRPEAGWYQKMSGFIFSSRGASTRRFWIRSFSGYSPVKCSKIIMFDDISKKNKVKRSNSVPKVVVVEKFSSWGSNRVRLIWYNLYHNLYHIRQRFFN